VCSAGLGGAGVQECLMCDMRHVDVIVFSLVDWCVHCVLLFVKPWPFVLRALYIIIGLIARQPGAIR